MSPNPADTTDAESAPRDDVALETAEAGSGSIALPTGENQQRAAVLGDLVDKADLQAIQDGFVDITGVNVIVRDAHAQPITQPTDLRAKRESDALVAELIGPDLQRADRSAAPIYLDGRLIGSITIESPVGLTPPAEDDDDRSGAFAPHTAASIQFMHLLAQSIERMCSSEHHLSQRMDELTALYRLSAELTQHDDLQQILDAAAREVASVLDVKAVSIRLIDEDKNQFSPRAVYNLSDTYRNHSPIFPADADLFKRAIEGETVIVEDLDSAKLPHDPDGPQREGLGAMICAGLTFRDKGMGVIQLFKEKPHRFGYFEVNLVRAIASILSSAIHAQQQSIEKQRRRQMQRQLHLAADVQRRMLPGRLPTVKQLDIAARYVPSLELGGDFYDVLELEGHLGIVIGDVVGKGVAASLLMASVRASLRAYAQDLYDIDEIVTRVNTALARDTVDKEFATLFYGVVDPATLRLTYCNAGHDPPLHWRKGKITALELGGMVVGVDNESKYKKGIVELKPGDALLLYTDGLVDAMNFENNRFGYSRIEKAFSEAIELNGAEASLNHILWECRRFTGMNNAPDDMTIVMVKVRE